MKSVKIFQSKELSSFSKHKINLKSKKTYTSDAWDTKSIHLIKKGNKWTCSIKIHDDVNFPIGTKIKNIEEPYTLCEIKLDLNNVPYINLEGNDYTKENCEAIKNAEVLFDVQGYQLMNYIDAVDEKQSVVVFSGDCFKKDVKEYFSSNFYTRELNDKGLSILLKLMETEEFQKAIEERIANDKKISLDLAKHENLIQEELSL